MKNTLHFSVVIHAPVALVWDAMLGTETYKVWTAEFCGGSYFEGSWSQGEKIRFLAPNGDGMVAVIAENRRHELVSIRHLGEISGGAEDTTSEKVRAWAPAYENYEFHSDKGSTEVRVSVDVTPEYESYMLDTYPKALNRLKLLCERG
jgi:hypothetical protein